MAFAPFHLIGSSNLAVQLTGPLFLWAYRVPISAMVCLRSIEFCPQSPIHQLICPIGKQLVSFSIGPLASVFGKSS